MDPSAPLTAPQCAKAIWAMALGFAAPWVLFIPAWLLIACWHDRRALRHAKARWEAWEAAHPREPPDDFTRQWQVRNQLWLESQPAHVQAHLLRLRLEEAEREAHVQAILEAERRGNVSNMLLAFSYHQAEFIAIHKYPDDAIMHPHRFGQTEGCAHEALQPGPEREVFPFNLLRLSFANGRLGWSEGAIVHTCTIGLEMVNSQRCQQCF